MQSARDQSHDIWRLELGKSKKYDVFSETQIFVLTNNLRCFDETDVRTSQKTTYAQFKIYRTNFIDEIGPWSGSKLFAKVICRGQKSPLAGVRIKLQYYHKNQWITNGLAKIVNLHLLKTYSKYNVNDVLSFSLEASWAASTMISWYIVGYSILKMYAHSVLNYMGENFQD